MTEILTDKTHVTSRSLSALHAWAATAGIKRCWFEGTRRGHPHYDLPKRVRGTVPAGTTLVTSKELLLAAKGAT